MALRFKNKKAAQSALAARQTLGPDVIIETSLFGTEYKDGTHSVVVSEAPHLVRNSFAQITVRNGRIVKIK